MNVTKTNVRVILDRHVLYEIFSLLTVETFPPIVTSARRRAKLLVRRLLVEDSVKFIDREI